MQPASPPRTLGQRIAQARREASARLRRDITQYDLAEAIGIGAATMSRWESDQAIPREDALARLAAYLDVTPAFLRYGIVGEPQIAAPAPQSGRLTDEEVEAAIARSDAARAAREAAANPPAKRARGER